MSQAASATAAKPFDFAPLLPAGLPAPAARWNGFPKYNFTGGHNDAAQVPVDELIAAATAVLPSGTNPISSGRFEKYRLDSIQIETIITAPIAIVAPAKPSQPIAATQSGENMTPPMLAPL